MKYVSIDIETTGLNPEEHKVIMIGAVIDDLANPIPANKLPCFGCIINQEQKGDPEAMEMNEWIFKLMPSEGVSQALFLEAFRGWLLSNGFKKDEKGIIKFTVAGKNVASFDIPFLNNIPGFSERFHIRRRCIDPAILYMSMADETLPDLQTCLGRAGIHKTVAHSALEDAADVVQLLRKKMPALLRMPALGLEGSQVPACVN